MQANVQYVTLGIGEELFAVPVAQVREILDARTIARVPRAPFALLGMIDVRGDTIPVVDLRRLLGFEEVEDTPQTRLIVLSVEGPAGAVLVAIRTDMVFEVTGLDHPALEPPVSLGGAGVAQVAQGIGRRNGRLVTVLALDELLAAEVPGALDGPALDGEAVRAA